MATGRKKPSKPTRALARARRPIVQAPLAQLPKGTGDRRALGRSLVVEALFPVPPPKVELPTGYAKVLGELKQRIEQTRLETVIAANTAMARLYWHLGHVILARQEQEGWGARVIDRLSYDLRQAFPDMNGLSARNLKYMRAFASAWTHREIVQAPLAQYLVPPPRADREARREIQASLVRRAGRGARLVSQHPRVSDRRPTSRERARRSTTSRGPCRPPIPISSRRCSRIPTCSISSAPPTRVRSTRSRRRSSRTSSASSWSLGRGSRLSDVKSRWRLAATTSSSTCSSITSSFVASSSSS